MTSIFNRTPIFSLLCLLAFPHLSLSASDTIKIGDISISVSGLSKEVPPIPSSNIYGIASYYNLTKSYAFPFPTAPIASAAPGASTEVESDTTAKFISIPTSSFAFNSHLLDLDAGSVQRFSVDEFYSTKATSYYGDEEGGEPASLLQPASLVSLKNISQYPAFDYIATNWNTTNPKGPSGGQAWNVEFVADPYPNSTRPGDQTNYMDGEIGNTDTMVLKVHYPEGSFSGNNLGGITFWSKVIPPGVQTALLTYEIAFSEKFDFVKGGKLPGFYGNKNAATFGSCSGGKHSVDCLSTRLMWRQKGAGEVYAYIPTYDGLCAEESLGCNSVYGMSVSRGAYKFSAKRWNTIALLVSLNTPNSNSSIPMLTTNNGLVALYKDDQLTMYHDNLVLRTDQNMTLTAVDFTTFFGGSAKSWATGKGGADTYFRNMKVFYSDSGSSLSGVSVLATASPGNETSSAPRFSNQTPGGIACLILLCFIPQTIKFASERW